MNKTMKIILNYLLAIGLVAAGSSLADEPKEKPLTNQDVIKMLENKIPDSVILGQIEAGHAKFDTSTDAIILLNKKGASENLLNTMLKSKPAPTEAPLDRSAQDAAATAKHAEPSVPPSPVGSGSAEKPGALSYGTA